LWRYCHFLFDCVGVMSVEAFGYVWRYAPQSGPAFLVLLAVADIANDQNGNEFWMSLQNLGLKTRLARSTVADAVKQLEAEGWLVRLESKPGHTIRYRFNFVEGKPVWDSRNQSASRTPNQSATRTGVVRDADRGSPPRGHNTEINTMETKTATPNGVQQLVTLYFDNFRGEVKPSGGQIAGHIQTLLKQLTYERLAQLIPLVALDGKPLTVNTVAFYANYQEKKSAPTLVPPPYKPSDAPVGVPMPDKVKELKKMLEGVGKLPE
jgi:biotin operon repressor